MSKVVSLVEEKDKVKSKIRDVTGMIFSSYKGRKDWIVSENGKMSVFITSSSLHLSKKYWFDLSVRDLLDWDKFEKAIVVFVLGSSQRVLIVPANALYELVKQSVKSLKVVSDATVKLHVERRDGEYVLHEANKASMSKYYNKYDFLLDFPWFRRHLIG
jgi:hypothetical protein